MHIRCGRVITVLLPYSKFSKILLFWIQILLVIFVKLTMWGSQNRPFLDQEFKEIRWIFLSMNHLFYLVSNFLLFKKNWPMANDFSDTSWTKVLFTSHCTRKNFRPSLLRLVHRLYTVIHKTQKTRMKVLPFATTGE